MKKLLLFFVAMLGMVANVMAEEVTFDFTAQGYGNAKDFNGTTIDLGSGVSLTLSKGKGSSTPKYYTSGSAMRLYGSNTATFSSTNDITSIVCTYASTGYVGTISADCGEYALSGTTGTWTGSSTSVTLTNTATSGHARLQKVVVTIDDGGVAKPTFSVAGGKYYDPQTISLDCTTTGASIIYWFNDAKEEYTEYSEPFTVSQSCTVHAVASLQGVSSKEATATYEIVPFTALDSKGKKVNAKYLNAPLTINYNGDVTGLTFKVNGVEKAYNEGIALAKPAANKNTIDTVSVYNGDELVAEQTYKYVPTVNSVSSVKSLVDSTEFCLSTTNSNQVTYITSDGKSAYLEDGTRGIYAYNLGLPFEAFKKFNGGYIWAEKITYKTGVVEMIACDSTATSTMAMGTTDFTLKTKTVAQCKLETNQLDYVKISSAQIVKADNGNYYAVSAADSVLIYDSFKTGVLTSLETTPCYADVYAIVSTYNGTVQLLPVKVENISDKINGTYGDVTWTIDMDGNMVFTPTNGVAGQLASTSTAASNRPWKDYATMVKNVKFDAGVSANKQIDYMFADMTNLESVDFTNLNTDATTSAKSLFSGCTNLKSADLSGLNLAGVTSVTLAFTNCSSLESVNLGENDFANVTDFSSMFNNCAALTAVDMHAATGAAATKVSSMFYGCSSLKKVDLRNFSTAGATYKVSTRGTITDNASNFFGSCTPDTLILSKNFGLYATSHYITLPTKKYMAVNNETGAYAGKYFDLPTDQAAFYEYSAAAEDYVTLVPCADFIITVDAENAKVTVVPTDETKAYAFGGGEAAIWTEDYAQEDANQYAQYIESESDPETYVSYGMLFKGTQTFELGNFGIEGAGDYAIYASYITWDGAAGAAGKVVYTTFTLSSATGINTVNATANTVNGKFIENGKVVIVKNGKKFNTAGAMLK